MVSCTTSVASEAPATPFSAAPAPASKETIFNSLRELSADRERAASGLRDFFSIADENGLGHLLRDDAMTVLHSTFTAQLPMLPAATIDAAQWLSLVKGFGIYGADDAISFQALLELYVQCLSALRDRFAPANVLRSMRRVARGGPRLKDHYDQFEFRLKDSLGKLYACRDNCSREARACRQIRKDKASAPVDHVRRSLARLTQLQHCGVPQIHEFLEDYHNFYVVSSPPVGVDIMDQIQDSYSQAQPLTEAWVASVAKQLLEVVACCHCQPWGPVVHRELKPENVLLSTVAASTPVHAEDMVRVTVTNFGLYVLFGASCLGSVLPAGCSLPLGSHQALPSYAMPEFHAPDVWRDDYGPRCDIWACGCIIFLLLTGCPPFGPQLPLSELGRMVSLGEPDWRLFRHVSTSALSLVRRMLSRDDTVRPTARECLRHPWFSNPGNDGRIAKELRLETIGYLMQFHADAKFQQVLMNLVAAELRVTDLRHTAAVFRRFDPRGTGVLPAQQLAEALAELGAAQQSVSQVLAAFDREGSGKDVPYGLFVAGCVDLVEDKLDHMLWKVFSMVDEDHSGEVGAVELEHFFAAACEESETTVDGETDPSSQSRPSSATSDVERYLRSVVEPGISAPEVVACVAGGRETTTFEDLKRYVLEGASALREASAGQAE